MTLYQKCLINNITIIVVWRSAVLNFLLSELYPFQKKNSNDEAGLYITNFKKLEHRPPTMIKERVDKDYSSVFRSALTSISKINKTDVETLRSSIGVRALCGRVAFLEVKRLTRIGARASLILPTLRQNGLKNSLGLDKSK